jgi:hypothetical protein
MSPEHSSTFRFSISEELARDRRMLFEEHDTSGFNNFLGNLPSGWRRLENLSDEQLADFRGNDPELYEAMRQKQTDIDSAITEAGLDIEIVRGLGFAISANDPDGKGYLERARQFRLALYRYSFPAYELLRTKYGYSSRSLTS